MRVPRNARRGNAARARNSESGTAGLGLRRAHHRDGAVGLRDHRRGHAAQVAPERRVGPRAHHDVVDLVALREGHQRFVPDHILKVLLDDPEGLAANLIGGLLMGVAMELMARYATLPAEEIHARVVARLRDHGLAWEEGA